MFELSAMLVTDGSEDNFWIPTTGVPEKNLRTAMDPIDKFDNRQLLLLFLELCPKCMS
jgi:hypothetical protein